MSVPGCPDSLIYYSDIWNGGWEFEFSSEFSSHKLYAEAMKNLCEEARLIFESSLKLCWSTAILRKLCQLLTNHYFRVCNIINSAKVSLISSKLIMHMVFIRSPKMVQKPGCVFTHRITVVGFILNCNYKFKKN